MKLFYFWPMIITLLFASMAEYGGGVFSTTRDYLLANLDKETSGVIIKSEGNIVGRWGAAAYDIRYDYTVNTVSYSGSQIDYTSKTSHYQEKIEKYPLGKKVTVYYDSTKPHYSALKKGSPGFHIYGIYAALIFSYIFFSWLDALIRRDEKEKVF